MFYILKGYLAKPAIAMKKEEKSELPGGRVEAR
jgi:hypothetical protein